jgi:hypothetical protein
MEAARQNEIKQRNRGGYDNFGAASGRRRHVEGSLRFYMLTSEKS